MSGKRVQLPCGHPGEHIVSQFVLCTTKGCDGKPRCPKCGTAQVRPYSAPNLPPGALACDPNGHVWWVP